MEYQARTVSRAVVARPGVRITSRSAPKHTKWSNTLVYAPSFPLMRSSRLYSQNEVQNQNKETDATTKPIKETQSTTTDVDPTEEVKTGIVVDDEKIPGAVKVFSALGMVPFIAGAVGPFVLPMEAAGQAVFFQMTYGATILTFLGAVHWGLAMANYKVPEFGPLTNHQQRLRYVFGVVPNLFAWWCLSIPPYQGMVGLLLGITAAFIGDSYASNSGLVPKWWMKLRFPLTFSAVFCLGMNFLQMNLM